jgi:hypothetical protein
MNLLIDLDGVEVDLADLFSDLNGELTDYSPAGRHR